VRHEAATEPEQNPLTSDHQNTARPSIHPAARARRSVGAGPSSPSRSRPYTACTADSHTNRIQFTGPITITSLRDGHREQLDRSPPNQPSGLRPVVLRLSTPPLYVREEGIEPPTPGSGSRCSIPGATRG
jgi:hypothetical protein